MISELFTERLALRALTPKDSSFVFELMNTPEWIRFIGDRNIRTLEDADGYIQKTLNNASVQYLVACIKEGMVPIGIITIIKRHYLEHHDIGFAFLTRFGKKGYAYEASKAVLDELMKDPKHEGIMATTVKDNENSIRLLKKLGLTLDREIEEQGQVLLVFALYK
jgi:RimJ/RimL family protein N-acetyltransferase